MKSNLIRLALRLVTVLACAATLPAAEVTVSAPDSPMLRFALGKLDAVIRQQGDALKQTAYPAPDPVPDIVVIVDPATRDAIGPDGFARVRVRQGLKITAGDERGAMYGLLDLVQEMRSGVPVNRIPDRAARAQLEFRAIKFNLPWSAYRTSPALEQHQETCRDLRYWETFLDMMAENRFNVLSLWSLHPYTYMIRPKNFPEACPFNDAELAEWKNLWSRIFAMAKERGIETYLLNWNIFVSPEFARAHKVAPWSVSLSHIGKETDTSDLVVRYTREVVTQVLNELPVLSNSKAPFSWASLTPAVEQDIEQAKTPLESPASQR